MGNNVKQSAYNYIVIEGVIGVGKTTLTHKLAERRQAKLVLEQFEENPFLERFYKDKERYAFQTELSFLASRFKQQQDISGPDLFSEFTLADYMFEKNRIFAGLTLDGDELNLYDKVYQIMREIAPKPDLIVFLQAGIDRLVDNIKRRGRSYEQDISPDYLRDLNDAYNHFFYHYTKSPVLVINTTDLDFVKNEEHLDLIEEHIFDRPVQGLTHINIRP